MSFTAHLEHVDRFQSHQSCWCVDVIETVLPFMSLSGLFMGEEA